MFFSKEIWTYITVTIVTIVIWFLAAGATRTQATFEATLHLQIPETTPWIVTPKRLDVQVTVEGSQFAIDRAQDFARRGLTLNLPAARGEEQLDLLDFLRSDQDFSTGISIVSVDPVLVRVDRDEIVSTPVRVRASLPGVQTVGEITIDPPEVSMLMPSATRDRVIGEMTAEAFLDRSQLERLEPGVRHEMEVRLRPSENIGGNHITINPDRVRLAFTIRSRTRSHTLDSVRVQLAGPPEDHREYIVEVEDAIIRNVTITAEGDLIRRIESDEVRIVAILHLDSREKEQRITSKSIAYFLALIPDPDGSTRGVVVDARIGDSATPPTVRFNIERKDRE